jgi:hypothetical protein
VLGGVRVDAKSERKQMSLLVLHKKAIANGATQTPITA